MSSRSCGSQKETQPQGFKRKVIRTTRALFYEQKKADSKVGLQKMVGVERFELPTSCSQSRRATRLRYTPKNVTHCRLKTTTRTCISMRNMVGVERFELPTSCSQSRRATRLRYTPLTATVTPAQWWLIIPIFPVPSTGKSHNSLLRVWRGFFMV